MNILQRYNRLSLWNKIGLWGSLASVVALVMVFWPSPKPVNASKTISQSMVNSPGGIQALGNVTITPDKRIIQSMFLEICVETKTAPQKPTGKQVDLGLGSVVALVKSNLTRILFVSDFRVVDQQIDSTTRQISFQYTPETPNEILGKETSFLSSVETLAVNYVNIFKTENFELKGKSTFNITVRINGVEVGSVSTQVEPPSILNAGPVGLNVAQLFQGIPERYMAEVANKAPQH